MTSQSKAQIMARLQGEYPTYNMGLQNYLHKFYLLKDTEPIRYVKLTKIQRVCYFFSYNRIALLIYWGKILPYITLIYNNVFAINGLFKQANVNSNLLLAKSIDELRFYRRRILSNRLNLELGINKMSKRQINIKINQIYDDALSFQLIADDLYKRIHNVFY
mgnify:FL=1